MGNHEVLLTINYARYPRIRPSIAVIAYAIITLKGKAAAHDAFLKSAELAQALGVDKADVLCTMNDIDDFFMN